MSGEKDALTASLEEFVTPLSFNPAPGQIPD